MEGFSMIDDLKEDAEFQSLPSAEKESILNNYFDQEMADDEFRDLNTTEQSRIKSSFMSEHITKDEEVKPEVVSSEPEEESPYAKLLQDEIKPLEEKEATDYVQDMFSGYFEGKVSEVLGASRPLLKVAAAVERFGQKLGIGDDKIDVLDYLDKNKEAVNKINKKQKERRESYGISFEAPLTQDETAEILVEALPLSRVHKLVQAAMGEGVLQGIMNYGEKGDTREAVMTGVTTTALTAVGGFAFNELSEFASEALKGNTGLWKNLKEGKATEKQAYNFLIEQTGSTGKELIEYNNAYSKAINKPIDEFTEVDKINAIMNNSEVASTFKIQSELYSGNVAGSVKKLDEDIRDIISEASKGGDLNIPVLEFKDYLKDSGEVYQEVKDTLLKHYNNTVQVSESTVASLTKAVKGSTVKTGDPAMVDQVLEYLNKASKGDGLNVEDLFDMKQKLNSLNLKSTKAYKAGEVNSLIDNLAEEAIGKEGFAIWKEANKGYSIKMLMESDNSIAKIFKDTGGFNNKSSISEKQLADAMLGLDKKGYSTFNSMRDAIGEEAMEKVEKSIVNIALNKKGGLSKFLENIEQFEFSTVAGRNLQKELNRVSGAISGEDMNMIMSKIHTGKTGSVGWSDNILNKARYAVVGKVWDSLTRKLPSGHHERALLTVGDVLKKSKAEITMAIKNDEAFQKAFTAEKAAFKDAINTLKAKGASRSASENKKLAEDIKTYNNMTLGVNSNVKKVPRNKRNDGDVSGRLQPRINAQVDTSGMLGMKHGGKATRHKGSNAGGKERLSKFMDDIANPKVNVDGNKVSELYDMLKGESTTMYAATVAKEKAWKQAMDIVGKTKSKSTVSPKERDAMMKAVKDYYDLLNDTI